MSDPNGRAELDEIWQDTMLAQFHDCLPGTTIKMVVNDNLEIYARRGKQARELIDAALTSLTGSKRVTDGASSSPETLFAIDPLRLKRNESVHLGHGKFGWLRTDPNGIGKLGGPTSSLHSPRAGQQGDAWVLFSDRFRLTISNGRINSLLDLAIDRELILPGPGADDGGLMLYEDYPLAYDAWDVEIYHLQSYRTIVFDEVTAAEDPLRASLIATAKFGKSTAKLTVRLRFCHEYLQC
jgi:alpha-mannosidase